MKKISILLFAAVLAFSSCNLDRFPLDTLSEKDLFSSESGLLAYTNSFYSSIFSGGEDLYEDDADTYIRDAGRSEYLNTSRITPASGGGWSFTALRKFNTLLDNCPKVKQLSVAAMFAKAIQCIETNESVSTHLDFDINLKS